MRKLIILLSTLLSSQAFSAQCKLGQDAYGASSGGRIPSRIGGSAASHEPPAATAVFPYLCKGKPCNVEIDVDDLLPTKEYEVIRVEVTTDANGNTKETTVFGPVDKAKEKEPAKDIADKAANVADEASKDADREEKESAEAKERADASEKEATDLAQAEKAAEESKKAAKEQKEAEAGRKEADEKAAEAEKAKEDAPPADDGGGLEEDDNIRPVQDGYDPQAEVEAKKEQARRDYALGKGKLDCSNPKVECVNKDFSNSETNAGFQISVPVMKGGVDCRYSRCIDGDEISSVEEATSLVNQVDDICKYSECGHFDDFEKEGDDCSPLGKRHVPTRVPIAIDKAILDGIKNGGLKAVKFEPKPLKPRGISPRPLHTIP